MLNPFSLFLDDNIMYAYVQFHPTIDIVADGEVLYLGSDQKGVGKTGVDTSDHCWTPLLHMMGRRIMCTCTPGCLCLLLPW